MTKKDLDKELEKYCSKEIETVKMAQLKINLDPSLSSFINMEELHHKLYLKVVRCCIDLVRRDKALPEELMFLLSLVSVEGSMIVNVHLQEIFWLSYHEMIRDN